MLLEEQWGWWDLISFVINQSVGVLTWWWRYVKSQRISKVVTTHPEERHYSPPDEMMYIGLALYGSLYIGNSGPKLTALNKTLLRENPKKQQSLHAKYPAVIPSTTISCWNRASVSHIKDPDEETLALPINHCKRHINVWLPYFASLCVTFNAMPAPSFTPGS